MSAKCRWVFAAAFLFIGGSDAGVVSAQEKPNILVIWGDDSGTWNISHNSQGMMGYKTPNIDRIAKDGISFTDYYAQQSCTAGRAAFLSGCVPVRSGITKVGLPGAARRLVRGIHKLIIWWDRAVDCRPHGPGGTVRGHPRTPMGRRGDGQRIKPP